MNEWTKTYKQNMLVGSGANPALYPICNIAQAKPERTTDYIVYATDGICWVSNEATPVRVTSDKPVIESISEPMLKCDDANSVHIKINATGTSALTYAWVDGITTYSTSAITVSPAISTTYTVTVTNNSCTSTATTSIKVNQNCCLTAGTGDVVIYVNTAPFIAKVEDLKAAINTVSSYYTFTDAVGTDPNLVDHIPSVPPNPTPIIYINGYFLVNDDLTFTDCIIRLGEQAEVHVKKGKTLRLTGCDIAGCGKAGTDEYTWRSIYADDETSKIIVENLGGTPTKIYDADTALNLSNRAKFNIINSEFGNNYNSIYFYNYMKDVDQDDDFGNIYGNKFKTTATPYLKIPPSGTPLQPYGLSGIKINFSENITIGKAGEAANTFENLYLGIDAYNANFHAYNNTFKQMHTNGYISNVGISAQSDDDGNDRIVVIGNSAITGAENSFDESSFGIYTAGHQNVIIDKNNFGLVTPLTRTAIRIFENNSQYINSSRTIRILNNSFEHFSIGTYLKNIGKGSDVLIDNNTYETADLTLSVSFKGTAITVQNVLPTILNLKITRNTITHPRIGIHTENISDVVIGGLDDLSNSLGNTISFDKGSSALTENYTGIWSQSCLRAHIAKNIIFNTDFSTEPLLRGIDVETSPNCDLNCNDIDFMARSINFNGDCDLTKLRENNMSNYSTGVKLEGAKINVDQGDIVTGDSWGNIWTPHASSVKKVAGTILGGGQINWYHEGADNAGNNLSPNPWQGIIILAIPNRDPAGLPCDDYSQPAGNRAANFGPVVGDSASYSESTTASRYLARLTSYRLMRHDTTIIYRDDDLDDDFESFYEDVGASNAGLFEQVLELALTDTAAARALNESITPDNEIEENLKTLYSIYFDKLANHIDLDAADTAALEAILAQPRATGGEAVHNAAVALFGEVHPTGSSERLMQNNSSNIPDEANGTGLKVYPNPASSMLTIMIDEQDKLINNLQIYNSQGKLVDAFSPNTSFININLFYFSSGLYNIKILFGSNEMESRSFSIIK